MRNVKKSRLLIVIIVVLLLAFLLSPFSGKANPMKASSVAAAGPYKVYLPLMMNNYPISMASTTTPTRTATPGVPTATFTKTKTPTRTATATPATPTKTPTRTPSATNTPVSTATPTPTITNTPDPTSTPTATTTPTPDTPQAPLFGVGVDHLTTAGGLDQVAAANISWTRLPGVQWSTVEASPGTYNWSVLADLETDLKNGSSDGFKVVLLVHSTPEWARKDGGTGPWCGPIAEAKLPDFAKFMKALVARYSVAPYNVKYWEIWNEEDTPYGTGDAGFGCWGDSSDAYFGGGYYAEMLKAVYPQIKAADPQAQVLIGGLLLGCDPRGGCAAGTSLPSMFLEGILRNNGGPYFDGVSFHSYDYYYGGLGEYYSPYWLSASSSTLPSWPSTLPTPTHFGPVFIAKAQFINSLLSQYGVTGKYLMNTESALICGKTGQEAPCVTDDMAYTKAYYIAQAYAAAIAQGLRANIWYSALGWRASGLLNGDLSPQPAYTAFKFATSELANAAYAGNIVSADLGGVSGVMGYKFQRGSRRVWIVWSLDGSTHSITLPGVPVAAWDALGNSVTKAATMDVTLNPLYLEWNP